MNLKQLRLLRGGKDIYELRYCLNHIRASSSLSKNLAGQGSDVRLINKLPIILPNTELLINAIALAILSISLVTSSLCSLFPGEALVTSTRKQYFLFPYFCKNTSMDFLDSSIFRVDFLEFEHIKPSLSNQLVEVGVSIKSASLGRFIIKSLNYMAFFMLWLIQ